MYIHFIFKLLYNISISFIKSVISRNNIVNKWLFNCFGKCESEIMRTCVVCVCCVCVCVLVLLLKINNKIIINEKLFK